MEIINGTPFQVEALPSKGPEDKTVLTVVVKGTFDIFPGEPAAVASEQIPVSFGDDLYGEKGGGSVKFESDVAPLKPRADIALVGRAHAPGGTPVEALDVSLRVGTVKKTVRVIGDRQWKYSGRLLPEVPTKPEPFTTMDIVYERAFGGIDTHGGGFCKENLVGRGFFVKKSKESLAGAQLPNLEDPDNLIKSWKDHPKPVGFGFYGRAWMPRASYISTYDEKWRRERSPDPPEDFQFDYYNGAHPDLQVKGYLKGGEEVELVNLTPDGTLRFQLPGWELNCSVTKSFDTVAPTPSRPAEEENEDVEELELDEDFKDELEADEAFDEDYYEEDEYEEEAESDLLGVWDLIIEEAPKERYGVFKSNIEIPTTIVIQSVTSKVRKSTSKQSWQVRVMKKRIK
jgi:hypothetical protein